MSSTVGSTKIAGVELLYIYITQGTPAARTKAELDVLEAFFKDYNANKPDTEGTFPGGENANPYPIVAAIVISSHHVSDSTPDENKHITLQLCSAAGWANDPRLSHSCVHVYSKNQTPEDGYEGYFIQAAKKKKPGPSFIAKIEEALNTPLLKSEST